MINIVFAFKKIKKTYTISVQNNRKYCLWVYCSLQNKKDKQQHNELVVPKSHPKSMKTEIVTVYIRTNSDNNRMCGYKDCPDEF